jgi:tRNA(Ile)-lysidine synthase
VSAADGGKPIKAAELRSLFADLSREPTVVLAVSGGPDSTALLVLAARWCRAKGGGPELVTVTVDHGLRPESKHEAAAVKRLARSLGVAHRTIRWTGRKPQTGLQDAARNARYQLLADVARKAGARYVVTAHTLDDQAETVLFRLARGTGLSGLAAMARVSRFPGERHSEPHGPADAVEGLVLVRPLLGIPKARLIATLRKLAIPYADDRSNRDPRFMRPRLRLAMPALEREGLSMDRLGLLAQRVRRADDALNFYVEEARAKLAPQGADDGSTVLPAAAYALLPAEIALRLLRMAIERIGDEGPVELRKLEALHAAVYRSKARIRRTLAGALITLDGRQLRIERAPRRRAAPKPP